MKEIQEVGRNRIEYKTRYGQSGKLVKGKGCFVNRLDGLGREKKEKRDRGRIREEDMKGLEEL